MPFSRQAVKSSRRWFGDLWVGFRFWTALEILHCPWGCLITKKRSFAKASQMQAISALMRIEEDVAEMLHRSAALLETEVLGEF